MSEGGDIAYDLVLEIRCAFSDWEVGCEEVTDGIAGERM